MSFRDVQLLRAIAGSVLHAVVVQVPRHSTCVMTRTTVSAVSGVLLCEHPRSVASVMAVPRTMTPLTSPRVVTPMAGRPRPQVTEPPSPFQRCASRLSLGWPLGRQDAGTQKVKPDARTWCHTEAGDPTPGTAHGTTASGAACPGCPLHAAHTTKTSVRCSGAFVTWFLAPPRVVSFRVGR